MIGWKFNACLALAALAIFHGAGYPPGEWWQAPLLIAGTTMLVVVGYSKGRSDERMFK